MHFSLYWVYDLPAWQFGLLTIAFFVTFGLLGLFPSRTWVRRQHKIDHSHNDIVSCFLAAITVFYGVTLGLVAAGTWETYSEVQSKIDHEAEVLSSLYRDVESYPPGERDVLQGDLRDYTHEVIFNSWPQQRQGIVPTGSDQYIVRFQRHLMAHDPQTPAQQIMQTEVFKQFNLLVEARRARLSNTNTGLPTALWSLVIIGALVSITVALFFDTPSLSMHFWMITLMSGLLGLMIFLVATLDNPFRGEVSVSPHPLELVYNQLMLPSAK